jgi:hypothetical protein
VPVLTLRVVHRPGAGCVFAGIEADHDQPGGPGGDPDGVREVPPPAVDLVGVGAGPPFPPVDHRRFLGAGGDGEDVSAVGGEVQRPRTQVGADGVHSR